MQYRNYAVIEQRWKLTRPSEDADDELYDLVDDPHESTNLAPMQGERVEAMRQSRSAVLTVESSSPSA